MELKQIPDCNQTLINESNFKKKGEVDESTVHFTAGSLFLDYLSQSLDFWLGMLKKIINIIIPWEFFTSPLADGLSLEFVWLS